MAPHLRVIPHDATTAAAQRITEHLAAEDLRRARQHIARLEDAMRVYGATDAQLDALRYGTTPPQPTTVTVDAPPPCDRCGDDGVMRVFGEVMCPDCAEATADAAIRGDDQ